jgi:hypothetical protein
MEYPKVQRNHIVPRGYLRGFEHDGRVQMHRVDSDFTAPISVREAAVHKNIYTRTRPDGTVIYDIEWSLSQAEDGALPLVRQLASRQLWPLDAEIKAKVGGFFALQLLRVPRWMDWYTQRIATTHEEIRARGITSRGGIVLPSSFVNRAGEEVQQTLQTDTARLLRMLHMVRKLGSIFASMHWTLIHFDEHFIATSDHPVVPWGHDILFGRPEPVQPQGLIDTLEVRLPLSCDAALLLTWINDEDYRLHGTEDQAARFNAFTVASAQHQWFHRPGSTPPLAQGLQRPISLCGTWNRYDPKAAERSPRRAKLNEWLQPLIGVEDEDQDLHVVSVKRAA